MPVPATRLLRPLLLSSAIALLSACGGGSSAPAAPAGSASGILTDGPVGGVSYTTSSGVTGVTDSDGRFRYNPGDTVTFRIGSLTLGALTVATADATITPLRLAEARTDLSDAERQNLVTNLLVLLQSLDSDGDASNGISVPGAVAAALTAVVADTLDLKVAPNTFAGNSTLSSLASTAGGTVVDPEAALAHFRTQFFKDVAGVYTIDLGGNAIIAFRINSDGSYMMAEVDQADDAGTSGIERGWLNWNPKTGEVSAYNISIDTNGEWGLSHPQADEKIHFTLDGSQLVVRVDFTDPAEQDEVLRLNRLTFGSGIVGPWALLKGDVPANSLDVQQFLFLPNGRYLMIDPVGDDDYSDPHDPKCGWEGLEYGQYSFVGGVLSTSGIIKDTNDCAGLHDSDTSVYTSFSNVTVVGDVLKAGDEVLLVKADALTPVYAGTTTVVSTTTGTPVVQDGGAATLYCAPPDEEGEESTVRVSLVFGTNTFTMKFAEEDELKTIQGSFNPATGAMAWEEIMPAEVVMQTETTTFYSSGSFVLNATYNATTDTVTGTIVDTSSTSWSRDASKVSCSATSELSISRVTAPSPAT